MDSTTNIIFKVTPSQKESIKMRMSENGFDDLAAYVKVVALKTQAFNFTSIASTTEEPSIEIGFNVTQSQKKHIDESINECGCEDLTSYLLYVALHGVVSAVVEIRSTGNLDAMLQRIADSKR